MVLIAAMVVAIISLTVNMLKGHGLLMASFIAVCVMLCSALVFLLAFKAVGDILQKQLLQEKNIDQAQDDKSGN